jgi:hypothetical protein
MNLEIRGRMEVRLVYILGCYGFAALLTLLVAFLPWSQVAHAYSASPVRMHYVKWVGVLPRPYETMEVEISLDPESYNVEGITISIGNHVLYLDENQMNMLKNVDLSTLVIEHEIFEEREWSEPRVMTNSQDWIYIYFEQGEKRKIELMENGKDVSIRSKDRTTITITEGFKVDVEVYRPKAP